MDTGACREGGKGLGTGANGIGVGAQKLWIIGTVSSINRLLDIVPLGYVQHCEVFPLC